MTLKPSVLQPFNDMVLNMLGKDTGKMLIITGTVGWIMSAAAQIGAIFINDKLPKEQKMFLVPQEAADACVNILSFLAVTQSFKSLGSALVKSGKWLPKSIHSLLKANGVADKIGQKGFNVFTDAGLSESALKRLNLFNNGMGVLSTTIGSVLSCNIITPIIRNKIAAKRQKTSIARWDERQKTYAPAKVSTVPYNRPTMADFMRGGSLKI